MPGRHPTEALASWGEATMETKNGWQDYLAEIPNLDLDMVRRALTRETAIRDMMTESGESREIVTETLDAIISMDEEAVLDLMEGRATTLSEGIQRYVEELEKRDELQPRDRITGELSALLAYPWPGLVTRTPERRLRACVQAWPEAETGSYDPRCCRFPKSCSATVYDSDKVTEADLETGD